MREEQQLGIAHRGVTFSVVTFLVTIILAVIVFDKENVTPQKEKKLKPPQTDTWYDADNEDDKEDDDYVSDLQQTHQHVGQSKESNEDDIQEQWHGSHVK